MRDAGPASAAAGPDTQPGDERSAGMTPDRVGSHAVPWTGRDVGRGILILFLVIGLLLIGLSLTVRRGGRPVGFELVFSTVSSTVLVEGVLLVLALWLASRRGAGLRQLGFRPFPARVLLQAGLVILAGFSINVVYAVAIRTLGFERFLPPSARDLLPLFGQGGWGLAVGLILAGVIAPLAEETFFRGFVFGGLLRPLGLPGAMVISSLVFAVVHLHPATVLPIFLLGCLLAWLYHQSSSLWPSIFVHGTYNSVALLAAYSVATRS